MTECSKKSSHYRCSRTLNVVVKACIFTPVLIQQSKGVCVTEGFKLNNGRLAISTITFNVTTLLVSSDQKYILARVFLEQLLMNKQCFSPFDSDLYKHMYIVEYFVLK